VTRDFRLPIALAFAAIAVRVWYAALPSLDRCVEKFLTIAGKVKTW
jgi:hypothetical protein